MPDQRDEAELRELEAALRGLVPQGGLDREALMFRAGRASARPGRGWPLAAATSTAAAAVLGALLWSHPGPVPVVRYVTVPVPAPQAAVKGQAPQAVAPRPAASAEESGPAAASPEMPTWLGASDAIRLREHVLHWGLDGLPPAPAPPRSEPGETPASLLRGQ
jgi:hypothetical protein